MSITPKAPPVYKPEPTRLAAPPVYRPNQSSAPGAQLKPANNFRLETRPAPPVYRPQAIGYSGVQPKPGGNLTLETRSRHTPGGLAIQRASIEIRGITSHTQEKDNTCWAATGRITHEFYSGNSHASERSFVHDQGAPNTLTEWDNDRVVDIDKIVGSQSKDNYLGSCDDCGIQGGDYSKSTFTKELKADKPIILNVDGNHYVTVIGKRKNGQDWELKVIDTSYKPDPCYWAKTFPTGSLKFNEIENPHGGTYRISVAYYAK